MNTTLCYIEQNDCYLMLHRTKKNQDPNAGKWIGVGGKFEPGESPDECLRREVTEETGLTLNSWQCRGIVTFVSDEWPTEYMHLFTSCGFSGTVQDCAEGQLLWVHKSQVPELPLWEGDRIFLKLLAQGQPFFLLTLRYQGPHLCQAILNGSPLPLA